MVLDRAPHALDRLLRSVARLRSPVKDRPDRRLLPVARPSCCSTLSDGVPAWLVAPVIVAARDDQARLIPNDLRPRNEAGAPQTLLDGRGVQRAVPHVGDIPREQLPGRLPIRAVVVRDLSDGARAWPHLLSPGGVVIHSIRRVGDHQPRPAAGKQSGDGSTVARISADQPVTAKLPNVANAHERGATSAALCGRRLVLTHDMRLCCSRRDARGGGMAEEYGRLEVMRRQLSRLGVLQHPSSRPFFFRGGSS